MENLMSTLEELSTETEFLIGIIVVGMIILLLIVLSIVNSKKVKKGLIEAETRYNSLKSIPLPFKLNKAVALARVNSAVANKVEESRNEFDTVSEQLKNCSSLLGEIDDLIYVHKTKQAKRQLAELNEILDRCEGGVHHLSQTFDQILEQESNQREQINKLKTQFRIDKDIIRENRDSFNIGIETLENMVTSIEKMFSTFEEWMFASEFSKAGQQQVEIQENVEHLELLIKQYPALYEMAKGQLPKLLDDTSYTFAQAKSKGVLLDHLEVSRNLETISGMLKDDLTHLGEGQIDNVGESMEECRKRLGQIKEQIIREEKAHDELEQAIPSLYQDLEDINHALVELKELYETVKVRFGFENWSDTLAETEKHIAEINDTKERFNQVYISANVPATTLLLSYNELSSEIDRMVNDLSKMKDRLDSACADEERAKKQLLKLQLIVNEINVKISKHRLPSISLKYEEDLRKANSMINEIAHLILATPLNVGELNEKIKESIDFIYTLFNSVNNLVGMAVMVENTIVFGNRYRSMYPEIDSELTRAELCFRNGQYTKALKIAIQSIERIHPGSYERLIRKTTQNA